MHHQSASIALGSEVASSLVLRHSRRCGLVRKSTKKILISFTRRMASSLRLPDSVLSCSVGWLLVHILGRCIVSRYLVQSHISYSSDVVHSSYYCSLTSSSVFVSKNLVARVRKMQYSRPHSTYLIRRSVTPAGIWGIGGLQNGPLIVDKNNVTSDAAHAEGRVK
jgi:hypothetical protein